MRLIDADKLKAIFHDDEYPCNLQTAILGIIDAQPTAYDPDKVVEELEGYREEMEQFGCSGMLSDMIEVVKGGEVDGN